MNDLNNLIYNVFENEILRRIVFSLPYNKDYNSFSKVNMNPYLNKGKLKYQFTYYFVNRVVHTNLDKEAAINEVIILISNIFRQSLINTVDKEYHVFASPKKKIKIIERVSNNKSLAFDTHNNQKKYIISDNTLAPFLIELGVMNSEGKVINEKYNKFRQINRFLEIIEDILPNLDTSKVINILDFGCGKSYLTFAVHYYFSSILKLNVNIVGLDLKKEVIDDCNRVAEKYKLNGIRFEVGNIKDYQKSDVDLVISLHACDVATDYALANAVKWDAKVILCVPCCQHEVNKQIKSDNLDGLLEYGLIKERIASLITDVSRAKILEMHNYKTQILEFIETEHTPKNILIRAIKSKEKRDINKNKEQLTRLKKEFNYSLTLEDILIS